jgi:hypothetical protein
VEGAASIIGATFLLGTNLWLGHHDSWIGLPFFLSNLANPIISFLASYIFLSKTKRVLKFIGIAEDTEKEPTA